MLTPRGTFILSTIHNPTRTAFFANQIPPDIRNFLALAFWAPSASSFAGIAIFTQAPNRTLLPLDRQDELNLRLALLDLELVDVLNLESQS